MNTTHNKERCCELCGEPMPKGEEMFKYHGYSGPCPKPKRACTCYQFSLNGVCEHLEKGGVILKVIHPKPTEEKVCSCLKNGCTTCNESCDSTPHIEEWEIGFRRLILSLDDLDSVGKYKIDNPIKGDIYFDGIEIEQFIRQLLSSSRKEGQREERERIREKVQRIQIEVDGVVCDCGVPYAGSDLAELIDDLLEALSPLIQEE